jgi:Reverse transcriptase (RNA-dependent DNA polymerase)
LLRQQDAPYVTSIDTSLDVLLPNGNTISSIGYCELNFPNVPQPVLCHIFMDDVLNTSLLSIAQLCRMGCVATFSAHSATVTYNDLPVLSAQKLADDNLWMLPNFPSPTSSSAANAAYALSTDAAFVKYTHAAFGSPSISTFEKAVRRGYLKSYPRLTPALLTAHPPHSIATAQGHLDQHRQGQNSTKVPHTLFTLDDTDDDTVATDAPTQATAYTQVVLMSDTLHSDLTGRFPVTSHNGAQYIFVSVLDGYIHVEAMKTRHHTEYVTAYKKTLNFFAAVGRRPAFQRLDNETSSQLETFALANTITIQYCPPHTHRSLKAERAIRTFKNHFIATLGTVAPEFPLTLWDELLPQAEICLNHLLPYGPNPSVSAYAGTHGGALDFTRHPIAPAGTRILIHDKPTARSSWAPHGVPGYYLGPALKHYRSYRVWASTSKTTRISDTLAWFPHGLTLPGPSPHDTLLTAAILLKKALAEFSSLPLHLRTNAQPGVSVITSVLTDLAENLDLDPDRPVGTDTDGTVSTPAHPSISPLTPLIDDVPLPQPRQEQRVIYDVQPTDQPPQHLPINSLSPPPVVHHNLATPNQYALPNTRLTGHSSQRPSVPLPPQILRAPTHALQFTAATTTLNLDEHGQPLRYSTAKTGPNALQWQQAESEELDRLLATETIRPIFLDQQPIDRRRDTTYYNPQTKEKQNAAGERTYRVRGTIGGDRINYPGPTTARTAAMPLVKILLQSVVSDASKWLTIDIKDYYLNTPLPRPEYLRISSKFLPSAVIQQHNLQQFLHNDTVLFQVNKGMYGLPQAGLLAQQRLITHLASHGYNQTDTTCLFRHVSNGTVFSLVVDDFGVKYTNMNGVNHLIQTLQALYSITIDWTGSKYLGFSIDFDQSQRSVTLSMPGYIAKVLQRFAPLLKVGANSPAVYVPPKYGDGQQTPFIDTSTRLSPSETTTLQEIVGSLLYYARGVDVTILPAVTHLSSLQAQPTQNVLQAAQRVLAYCSRYPNNALRYYACNMVLHIQSDASYLSRPNARSVAGAIFYLGNANEPTLINGSIHAFSSIIPSVVASVAEAEYAALFQAGQDGAWLRNILHSLGYPQPPTIILCDNKCAEGIALDTIKPKRTKSIDMRFHWIRDRILQKQFTVTWRKGVDNLADFFTKPLPVHLHQSLMPLLVHVPHASSASNLTSSALRATKHRMTKGVPCPTALPTCFVVEDPMVGHPPSGNITLDGGGSGDSPFGRHTLLPSSRNPSYISENRTTGLSITTDYC